MIKGLIGFYQMMYIVIYKVKKDTFKAQTANVFVYNQNTTDKRQ